jgi:putative FmdB family regulatory protein
MARDLNAIALSKSPESGLNRRGVCCRFKMLGFPRDWRAPVLSVSFLPGSVMPIYAYKCASCGHAKDVLQKISDPVLTLCPQCGESSFAKQLTAAGFQLKGSGWYATDFKGGSAAKEPAVPCAEGAAKSEGSAAPAACAGCPAAAPAAATGAAAAD